MVSEGQVSQHGAGADSGAGGVGGRPAAHGDGEC